MPTTEMPRSDSLHSRPNSVVNSPGESENSSQVASQLSQDQQELQNVTDDDMIALLNGHSRQHTPSPSSPSQTLFVSPGQGKVDGRQQLQSHGDGLHGSLGADLGDVSLNPFTGKLDRLGDEDRAEVEVVESDSDDDCVITHVVRARSEEKSIKRSGAERIGLPTPAKTPAKNREKSINGSVANKKRHAPIRKEEEEEESEAEFEKTPSKKQKISHGAATVQHKNGKKGATQKNFKGVAPKSVPKEKGKGGKGNGFKNGYETAERIEEVHNPAQEVLIDFSYGGSSSNMVTLLVGPDKKPFNIHKGKLCDNSKYFKDLFNEEKEDKIYELLNFDAGIFSRYINYLYYNQLDDLKIPDFVSPKTLELTKLWVLGHTIQSPMLRQGAIVLLFGRFKHETDIVPPARNEAGELSVRGKKFVESFHLAFSAGHGTTLARLMTDRIVRLLNLGADVDLWFSYMPMAMQQMVLERAAWVLKAYAKKGKVGEMPFKVENYLER